MSRISKAVPREPRPLGQDQDGLECYYSPRSPAPPAKPERPLSALELMYAYYDRL